MEPREALPKDIWDSQLSAITPLMVDEYLSKRTTERKPASVNKESQLLHHMFKKAMEWGQAIGNPITHVEPLPVNNRRLRYLSQRELMGHKTIAMTLRYGTPGARLSTGRHQPPGHLYGHHALRARCKRLR
jgi:hypothetical protein